MSDRHRADRRPEPTVAVADADVGRRARTVERRRRGRRRRTAAIPTPRQYVMIAVILVILTAFEIAALLPRHRPHEPASSRRCSAMAVVKFFLVAAWYMHMKSDQPFFRRFFVVGIVGACIVYGIVLLVFSSTVLKS